MYSSSCSLIPPDTLTPFTHSPSSRRQAASPPTPPTRAPRAPPVPPPTSCAIAAYRAPWAWPGRGARASHARPASLGRSPARGGAHRARLARGGRRRITVRRIACQVNGSNTRVGVRAHPARLRFRVRRLAGHDPKQRRKLSHPVS